MIAMMRTAILRNVGGAVALTVALAAVLPAFAQAPAARQGPPAGGGAGAGAAAGARPAAGRDICGGAIVGRAPDIMTYDSSTGTQVFVGRPDAETSMAAYNTRTGSSAAVEGDLTRPGLANLCSVDGVGRASVAVAPNGRGGVTIAGRDGQDRWAVVKDQNGRVIWSPGAENDCFKAGIGIMTRDGLIGPAIAAGPNRAGLGVSVGSGFAGLGVAADERTAAVGLVTC
jgi:hypothetical protein